MGDNGRVSGMIANDDSFVIHSPCFTKAVNAGRIAICAFEWILCIMVHEEHPCLLRLPVNLLMMHGWPYCIHVRQAFGGTRR